jgi:hypothetical protein
MEIVSVGLVQFLNNLTSLMTGWFSVGLFQNKWTPRLADNLGAVVPADFPGYNGLRLLYGWTAGAMFGVRARSHADDIKWVHDGRPGTNDIYGYYVVNKAGALAFAERWCDGPFTIDRKGRSIKLTPQFEAKNERED